MAEQVLENGCAYPNSQKGFGKEGNNTHHRSDQIPGIEPMPMPQQWSRKAMRDQETSVS
jgi:hypothetical protein